MENPVNSKRPTAGEDACTLRPRAYQLEMFDESAKRNVIVAMDTGSGKTHVLVWKDSQSVKVVLRMNSAVLRIEHELQRCRLDQLVWFLAPKVALAEQQYKVLRKALAKFEHRFLCGADGIDKWKTQAVWDSVLLNVRVVACTPRVLLDALTHGFVRMHQIALLVFDEAHHCVGNTPMNIIMNEFYSRSKQLGEETPSVLGLTASPVRKLKLKDIDEIEANLDATIISPKLHRSELLECSNRPETIPYFYSSLDIPPNSSLLLNLQGTFDSYDINEDPYVQELNRSHDANEKQQLAKIFLKRKTWCLTQLKALLLRAKELRYQLGPPAVNWYLKKCSANLDKLFHEQTNSLVLDCKETERRHLQSLLHGVIHNHQSQIDTSIDSLSKKFQCLLEVLSSNFSSNFTGIVFVKQRATVAALAELLSCTPAIQARFRVGSFVGSSLNLFRKANISDLADNKAQQSILDAFRSGNINLIIATEVLGEGIDIPACNLVVCFDYPDHLISFVQRRGRARQQKSKFVIFFPNGSSEVQKWQSEERMLAQIYADEEREHEEEVRAEEIDEAADRQLFVESTGALLTFENCLSHLHHFCNTLHRQYVDTKPTFSITEADVVDEACVYATVILPSSLDAGLRTARSKCFWLTEKRAKQDAAFVAYQQLYEAKLVNDHLLPTTDFEMEPHDAETAQLTSLLEVSGLFDPWLYWAQLWNNQDASTICTPFSFDFPDGRTQTVLLASPTDLPPHLTFSLYWQSNMRITVSVGRPMPINDDQIEDIRRASSTLTKAVFAKNRNDEHVDFLAPFFPDMPFGNLRTWTSNTSTRYNLEQSTDIHGGVLVYDKARFGVPFEAHEISMTFPSRDHSRWRKEIETGFEIEERWCVAMQRFPKPRNFLKALPRQQKQAEREYRTLRQVPVEYCITNCLPSKLAISTYLTPSTLRHLRNVLVARELQTTVLRPVGLDNVERILEAICAPAADENVKYERLEHLGDCVLKLLTSLYLMATYPQAPERQLTAIKSRLVSNQNLAKAAIAKGLDRFIIAENQAMEGPLYIDELLEESQYPPERRHLSRKTLADVVESLIGASFMEGYSSIPDKGDSSNGQALEAGLTKGLECLKVFLPEERWQTLSFLKDRIFDIAMPSRDNSRHHNLTLAGDQVDQAETLLDYTFTSKPLLVNALTHPSYNQDLSQPTYDRLEFLGDALLDLLVTSALFTTYPHVPHHRMHILRECIVNQHILAFLNMSRVVSVERMYLVDYSETNHDPEFETQAIQSSHSLWHHMLRNLMDAPLTDALAKAEEAHARLFPSIHKALKKSAVYPWPDLLSLGAPKCVSDIMESAIAAIWLDVDSAPLGAAFDAISAFVDNFGIMTLMHRIARDEVECRTPKERLMILAAGENVEFRVIHPDGTSDDKNTGAEPIEEGSTNIIDIGARADQSNELAVVVADVELARIRMPKVMKSEVMTETTVSYINQSRLAEQAIEKWSEKGGGAEIVRLEKESRAEDEKRRDVEAEAEAGSDEEEGGVDVRRVEEGKV